MRPKPTPEKLNPRRRADEDHQLAMVREHHATEAARGLNKKGTRLALGHRAIVHALLAIAWVGVQMFRELRRIRRALEQRPTATINLQGRTQPKEG